MKYRGFKTLRVHDPGYPAALKGGGACPSSLYLEGAVSRRDVLAVAVVGSRAPTAYGRFMAGKIAGELAARGVTIISGLARGIDTEAHRAALAAGGRTIAVLGCGLDVDYPRGSSDLKMKIAANGALVTEFELSTPPRPGNFPRRNRIISGLSLGVVVVEATLRSGSLITARWAADQGREVMAVPGRADSRLSEGPLSLIRDGAAPVATAGDVLEVLGIDLPAAAVEEKTGGLLAELACRPMTAAELAVSCSRHPGGVMAELTSLEMDGKVHRRPGGFYALSRSPVSKKG